MDADGAPDARVELANRVGEAVWAPPLRQMLGIGPGCEHQRRRRIEDPRDRHFTFGRLPVLLERRKSCSFSLSALRLGAVEIGRKLIERAGPAAVHAVMRRGEGLSLLFTGVERRPAKGEFRLAARVVERDGRQ